MAFLLEGEHVNKVYEGVIALDDVSFKVSEGEIIGLIGPNGAGKTTLLSCISGTQVLSSGCIRYQEKVINKYPVYRRTRLGIGRTFQIVQPFKSLTVFENLLVADIFAGRCSHNKRVGKIDHHSRLHEILKLCELSKKCDMRANELDLPEQKRLEFARALATNAKLLLLDEVMAGLNRVEMTNVIDLIYKINSEGITIILVEHVMKAVMKLSTKIIVLNHGKKIAEGPPEAVASNDEVIKAYLGPALITKTTEEKTC